MDTETVEVTTQSSGYWWLSFCDPDKPEGSQFLGVAIVEGRTIAHALHFAWAIGCNPGGEVQGWLLPEQDLSPFPFPEYLNRLLTKQEALQLNELCGAWTRPWSRAQMTLPARFGSDMASSVLHSAHPRELSVTWCGGSLKFYDLILPFKLWLQAVRKPESAPLRPKLCPECIVEYEKMKRFMNEIYGDGFIERLFKR